METFSTTLKLNSLNPNTQYIAYIEAISTKTNKTSDPSETIIGKYRYGHPNLDTHSILESGLRCPCL